MKNGTPFSVYIRNNSITTYICRLEIDHREMGMYMIDGTSAYTIRRPVAVDKKFVFVVDQQQQQVPVRVTLKFYVLTTKQQKLFIAQQQAQQAQQQAQQAQQQAQQQQPQQQPGGVSQGTKAVLGDQSFQDVTAVQCFANDVPSTVP